MTNSAPTTTPIAVEEALNYILDHIKPLPVEVLPITQCLNRILAQEAVSDCDVPPFVNAAMDGYAVIAADLGECSATNPVKLKVIENIPAGVAPQKEVVLGTAARIMTGAPMPLGANAIVRFEETSEAQPLSGLSGLADDEVAILHPISVNENVRPAGEDVQKGQIVLPKGKRLRPQDIGLLAATGGGHIAVHKIPRVAILATGDELVGVEEPLTPGKIRNSNEYTQAALVQSYGAEPVMLGVARDNIKDLTNKIRTGLKHKVDLFLTSAGVSVGDYDIVKTVLATEGVMRFWQVAIKPGKPLAFGVIEGVPLVGLPGNPVAAMIAFEVFARPAILKLAGYRNWEKPTLKATLQEDVYNSGREHYMRAFVSQTAAGYQVTTRGSGVQVQGSGIVSSRVWANALVVVPNEIRRLPAGTEVDVWLLDWRGEQIPFVNPFVKSKEDVEG